MTTTTKHPVLIVGLVQDAPNLRYVTGFAAPDAVVYLEHGKRRVLVVTALEYGRASRQATRTEVVTPAQLGLTSTQQRKLHFWIAGLLKRERIRRVKVSPSFPIALADQLRANGFKIVVAKSALFPERQVKSASEIRKMREVQQSAVIAMRAAIRMLREASVDRNGRLRHASQTLTSEAVRRVIERALLDRDCSGRETIVAGGKQAADPHERGTGPLRAGEAIVIDIFPQHKDHGYWGDLSRTVVKGPASSELTRMYRAVRAAQRAALEAIRPRIQAKTVHQEACRIFAERGYHTRLEGGLPEGFIHGTGHGVGLEIHEGPSLSDNCTRLRKGNVLTVEPGLYYPGLGGIRIEDTIVVTADGWRYLFPCEKNFEV